MTITSADLPPICHFFVPFGQRGLFPLAGPFQQHAMGDPTERRRGGECRVCWLFVPPPHQQQMGRELLLYTAWCALVMCSICFLSYLTVDRQVPRNGACSSRSLPIVCLAPSGRNASQAVLDRKAHVVAWSVDEHVQSSLPKCDSYNETVWLVSSFVTCHCPMIQLVETSLFVQFRSSISPNPVSFTSFAQSSPVLPLLRVDGHDPLQRPEPVVRETLLNVHLVVLPVHRHHPPPHVRPRRPDAPEQGLEGPPHPPERHRQQVLHVEPAQRHLLLLGPARQLLAPQLGDVLIRQREPRLERYLVQRHPEHLGLQEGHHALHRDLHRGRCC